MNNRFQHYEKLPSGLTPQHLYEYISKEADNHEPAMKYDQPLLEEELNDFRAKFADEAIELNGQRDEMKEEVRVLKKRIKDIENSMATKLKVIAERQITIVEPAFGFKDIEFKQMVWVNSEGIIVGARSLDGEELQMSIPMQKVRNLHAPKKDKSAQEALEEGEF